MLNTVTWPNIRIKAWLRLFFGTSQEYCYCVHSHYPKEAMHVLNDAMKYATSADVQLRKLLAQGGKNVPEMIDLELSKYTNYRGAKKIMFRPEHEKMSPEENNGFRSCNCDGLDLSIYVFLTTVKQI